MMETGQSTEEAGHEERTAFMLTESHEFITNLLSYLPAKDLCRSARVCKSWRRTAERLLRSRESISWSCVNNYEAEGSHVMAAFEADFEECVKSLWSIPSKVLVFTEFVNWQESAELSGYKEKNSSRRHKKLVATLRSRLPVDTSLLCLQTPGTIGLKRNFRLLGESESDGGISCLLLPEMDDVQVHQFECEARSLNQQPSMELIEQICGPTTVDNCAKCILIFVGPTLHYNTSMVWLLNRSFQRELNASPVIAGAVVRRIEGARRGTNLGGLVFSGQNVTAASVLLREEVSTRKQVKDCLQPLNSLDISKGTTIGFMFACIGRGAHHYGDEDVESQVFRECFPNVPLFGLFGNGEIGCENLTMTRGHRDEADRLPSLDHAYTTVMVLLNLR